MNCIYASFLLFLYPICLLERETQRLHKVIELFSSKNYIIYTDIECFSGFYEVSIVLGNILQ